jgi:hypothetical protein
MGQLRSLRRVIGCVSELSFVGTPFVLTLYL